MRLRLKLAIYVIAALSAGYLLLVSKPYSWGVILAPTIILAAMFAGRLLVNVNSRRSD